MSTILSIIGRIRKNIIGKKLSIIGQGLSVMLNTFNYSLCSNYAGIIDLGLILAITY